MGLVRNVVFKSNGIMNPQWDEKVLNFSLVLHDMCPQGANLIRANIGLVSDRHIKRLKSKERSEQSSQSFPLDNSQVSNAGKIERNS